MIVDEEFLARWAGWLAIEVPDAVAVFLKGSYARDGAGPHSDVDFDVVVAGVREFAYPTWLDEHGGRLVHVTVSVRDADAWLAEEDKPEDWALGFPSAEATRLMWARDAGWRTRLDRAFLRHPAATPELEDFVDELGKMANARHTGDELALRSAAQRLARYCPGILLRFNEPTVVGTAYEALTRALDLAVVPPDYRADMIACLGYVHADSRDLWAAALRLVGGVVATCEAEPEVLAGDVAETLRLQLIDGSLARYVRQLAG